MRYPTTTNSISIRDLTAGYGASTVLDGISLDLPPSGVSVIVGPGGSGKSTLVRAFCDFEGEDFWTRGSISVPEGEFAIQQQIPKTPANVLWELIVSKDKLSGCGEEESKQRALEAMVGIPALARSLEPHLSHPISELPRSLLRSAQFIGVASRSASWYVFDEPDADLADDQIAEVENILAELGRKAPVLLVTHHLSLGRRLADQATLIEDGRLVETGPGNVFFSRPSQPRTQQFLRYGS